MRFTRVGGTSLNMCGIQVITRCQLLIRLPVLNASGCQFSIRLAASPQYVWLPVLNTSGCQFSIRLAASSQYVWLQVLSTSGRQFSWNQVAHETCLVTCATTVVAHAIIYNSELRLPACPRSFGCISVEHASVRLHEGFMCNP